MPLESDQLTDEVILKLYAQTRRKMKRLNGRLAASRTTSEDIVHEAIMKTMSNERPWRPERCPSLYDHLAGCIKSIIFNTGNLKETKLVKREGINKISTIFDRFRMSKDQEISFSIEQNQIAISDLKFYIDYISQHRNDLLDLANAVMVDDISKPKDLAKHLDITVREANTKKLALKRVIKKLQGENR